MRQEAPSCCAPQSLRCFSSAAVSLACAGARRRLGRLQGRERLAPTPRSTPARASSRPARPRATISPSPITTARSRSGRRTTTTLRSPTTTTSIRINPKYAKSFNNRGNVWKDKGDLDRAIADYNEAIRLDREIRARLCQPRRRVGRQGRRATAPSRTSTRRSSSIRNIPAPTTCAAWCGRRRATLTARIADFTDAIRQRSEIRDRLRQSRRRLGRQGRPGPRHRRPDRGDADLSRTTRAPTTSAA